MYQRVLLAFQISISELLCPAVLCGVNHIYVLLVDSGCGGVLLLSRCFAVCPLAPWQAFRFLSFHRIVIEL